MEWNRGGQGVEELLHVTSRATWEAAGCVPCPAGGFIHLCTAAQLEFVLTRHFAGETGLVLLVLDPAGLDVRWEASEAGMAPFPHLYGDLRAGCVIGTRAV